MFGSRSWQNYSFTWHKRLQLGIASEKKHRSVHAWSLLQAMVLFRSRRLFVSGFSRVTVVWAILVGVVSSILVFKSLFKLARPNRFVFFVSALTRFRFWTELPLWFRNFSIWSLNARKRMLFNLPLILALSSVSWRFWSWTGPSARLAISTHLIIIKY